MKTIPKPVPEGKIKLIFGDKSEDLYDKHDSMPASAVEARQITDSDNWRLYDSSGQLAKGSDVRVVWSHEDLCELLKEKFVEEALKTPYTTMEELAEHDLRFTYDVERKAEDTDAAWIRANMQQIAYEALWYEARESNRFIWLEDSDVGALRLADGDEDECVISAMEDAGGCEDLCSHPVLEFMKWAQQQGVELKTADGAIVSAVELLARQMGYDPVKLCKEMEVVDAWTKAQGPR